ncbi:hypothetical protein B0H17DRAFT_1127777 [Mycena rosella]|uniref:Uncharacterized protein n=1 Tax=Mycena rosella TaxID=1033263 RepID=A0AAD7DYU6_MYCRO|nr:hypothetical protein B0H17DRAFT_1127777 [Mycena rosella]
MARAPSRRFRHRLAYLHRALRKPTPTRVVTAVSHARLSLSGNSLRHVTCGASYSERPPGEGSLLPMPRMPVRHREFYKLDIVGRLSNALGVLKLATELTGGQFQLFKLSKTGSKNLMACARVRMSATPISVWYRGLTLKSGLRGVARELHLLCRPQLCI